MIDQVFHVATEFRFNASQAILSSQTLQDEVGKISAAADNALISFQQLGAGIVANLGFGAGGLLTVLGKAVQIADKFNGSALSFSNVIGSNMKFLSGTIDTFNDRLSTSEMIMDNISNIANQWALPSSQLLSTTKILAPVLIPHGLAGTNFKNAIDMSKNVLKSAPNLGIDPHETEGQLIRAITGQGHMSDTLLRRLMTETGAFRDAHINNTGQLNAMPFDKRFALLNKSLAQFSSDSDVLRNRVNSLSGQMTILANNFTEFGSVLRPIGQALTKPIVMILKSINDYAQNEGRHMAKSLSKLIMNVFEDPLNLLITMKQLSNLKQDTKKGAELFGLVELGAMLYHLKNFLPAGNLVAVAIGTMFSALGRGIMLLVGIIPFARVFGFLLQAVWFGISRLMPGMLAAVGFFQTISRAKAIAQVNDAKNMLTLGPELVDIFAKIKNAIEMVMYPFTVVFDFLANLIAPLFQVTTYLKPAMSALSFFADILTTIGKAVILATGTLQGLFFALYQIVDNIRAGKLNIFAGVGDAFKGGIDDIIEKNASKLFGDGTGAVVNQVMNVGKVEINNSFKENQQPDRIAFQIKDQLQKAAKNPTQGRGTSLSGAFGR